MGKKLTQKSALELMGRLEDVKDALFQYGIVGAAQSLEEAIAGIPNMDDEDVDFPDRKPCDDDCCGAFVNVETLKVERCDTCKRFLCDRGAADFVNYVLRGTKL